MPKSMDFSNSIADILFLEKQFPENLEWMQNLIKKKKSIKK